MTQTDLCNIALSLLGIRETVSSIDEQSVPAQTLKQHWDLCRDEALKARDWSFAIKRAVLVADAVAPAFDFAYAYVLPTDCISVREFNCKLAGTSDADYETNARHILSNDTYANLRYTYKNVTIGEWAAPFCDLFTHLLASAVAGALSGAPGLAADMRARAEEIAVQATGPDMKETRPRAILAHTNSGWMRARMGGGLYEDCGCRILPNPSPVQP